MLTGDLISLNVFIFSVESASVPDLIPLPYHSSAGTNSNSDDGNTEQLPLQSPVEGTDDEMVVDRPPGSCTSDFIFPCQPDTVRGRLAVVYDDQLHQDINITHFTLFV